MSKPSVLIAFGGNALDVRQDSKELYYKEEFLVARRSMESVIKLIEEGYTKIVITHGNGPQVGRILLQQELTASQFPRQTTLDVCVADSQGRIGNILQNVFYNSCRHKGITKTAATIVTQAVVDKNDPSFKNPTKPIGSFYSKEDAEKFMREKGWVMKEDSGRGWRRLVPSPIPIDVIEKEAIMGLVESNVICICGGGGGIPVTLNEQGEVRGVDAVIDKDRTSALIAKLVGVDVMVILTEASYVYTNFNTPEVRPIRKANVSEMEKYISEGHFAAGSMKPKVEAALSFIKNGGKRAIIANLFELPEALQGKTGTEILPN